MLSLQNLKPEDAHFCLQIENICRKRLGIKEGSHLLIALSGGADSTGLTLALKLLAPRLRIELSALYLNHGLRKAAAREAAFVQNFCEAITVHCKVETANIRKLAQDHSLGLEEAGRLARYEILEKQRQKTGANYIVTGHQADDLAEDILMRLIRGAGWPALGGMPWQTGFIIRPLLHTPKARIERFVKNLGFHWLEDETNQSLAFRRNRMRHLLLPMLRCENPAIVSTLPRLHELARIDASYWNELLNSALEKTPWQKRETDTGQELLLPKLLLASLPQAARLRLYHRVLWSLRQNTQNTGQARADNLLKLDEIYQANIGGKTVQCSGGITATLKQGNLIFQHSQNSR